MNFASVRMITDDVDRLVDFYETVTRVSAVRYTPQFAEVHFPAFTLAIGHSDTVGLFGSGSAHAADNHSLIVEFLADDVDAEYERLQDRDYDWVQAPTTMPWGNRSIVLRDPDGNLVNLFQPVTDDAIARFKEAQTELGSHVVNPEGCNLRACNPAGASIAEAIHHRVKVNGTDLHFVEAGSHGSPVLLVHGFPESWWTFRGVIPRLADTHRVFAVDLRGFGDSAHDGEIFDSATSAEDLRLLIEHLDAGPVHLTGQDIAGAATFRLAATSPGSLKSYTAIEAALPGFGGEVLADVTKGGAWYIGALIAPGVPELLFADREREFLADYLFPAYGAVPPAVTSTDIDEFVRVYARPHGFSGAIGLYRSLLQEGDTIQALAKRPLQMPLMAIGAAAGHFTHSTMTAAAGPNVRSVLLGGVGHYAALEAPDKVADALLDFFATVDAA